MKALSVTGKIDEQGRLLLDEPLNISPANHTVRVIVLVPDTETEKELEGDRSGEYQNRELMPLDKFRKEFKKSLAVAGYDSREKIVQLVQDIKREMAAERTEKSRI